MERRGRWRLPRGKHGIDLVRTSTLSCGQDKSYRESKDSDDARIPHEQFALSHKPPKGGLSENAYFARGSLNPANRLLNGLLGCGGGAMGGRGPRFWPPPRP
jgi:hypothetical protein